MRFYSDLRTVITVIRGFMYVFIIDLPERIIYLVGVVEYKAVGRDIQHREH